MLLWPGNSWVYWAAAAAAVFLLLRFVVYGDRFSRGSRRTRWLIAAGAAASVVAVGVLPGVVQASGQALTVAGWWIDPVLWLSGSTLAAAALFLCAWALFGDRSRGRRRCPKCWYDMSGTPGLKCPECGREAKRERRLFRARRRKFAAAIAIFALCTGVSVGVWPWFHRSNWEDRTPHWAVLVAAPFVRDTRGPQQAFGDRLSRLVEWRVGYDPYIRVEGSITQDLRDGAAPGWKRWLARQSASLGARDGASETAQRAAVHLVVALGEDAAPLAARMESLCLTGTAPDIRHGALICMRQLSKENDRAMATAVSMTADGDAACRRAAAETLGILGGRGERIAAPAELLSLAADADAEVRTVAFAAMASFAPTDELVRLLEAKVRSPGGATIGAPTIKAPLPSLAEAYTALASLVRVKPDSVVARRRAVLLLRSRATSDLTHTAEIMASSAWFDDELLGALAARLEAQPERWETLQILDRFATIKQMSAQQSFDVLLTLAQRPALRPYVAGAFAQMKERGQPFVPRLEQLATDWDSSDPDAAAKLRESIEEIRGSGPLEGEE